MTKKLNYKLAGVIVFCVLLAVFTFLDLPVAKAMYHPDSLFGRFFEIVGTIPLPFVGVFSCVALIGTAEKRFCLGTIISYVSGGLMLLYSAFYGVLCIAHAWEATAVPMAVATVVWFVASIIITKKIVKSGNGEALRKAAIIGVCASFVATIGVSVIKGFVSRPRFYALTDPDTQFTYWFQIMPSLENAGFPSGHSAQSALTFFTVFIPTFLNVKNEKQFTKTAMILSAVFTGCVMFSRMVLGMHYATDVLVGATLSIATMVGVDVVYEKIKSVQLKKVHVNNAVMRENLEM